MTQANNGFLSPAASLEHLDNMEKLDLRYNHLVSVGPGIFKGLSRLRQLYLNNNRLTVVQQGSLDMLPALEVQMKPAASFIPRVCVCVYVTDPSSV